MLPPAFAAVQVRKLLQPLAIAVIGAILTSVLSLVVTPAVTSMSDGVAESKGVTQ
jgi:Cu/Ag efflux pump CusA